ncbi:MAG: DUF1361 domain-containing protein [Oscillochloris sp.]|nr:DUF1361 domain-containing protein [Oscillochloris sp.]
MMCKLQSLHRFLMARLFYPALAASMLAMTLFAGRMVFTGSPAYRFLIWNLFLAWLPYLAALQLDWIDRYAPRLHWQRWPLGMVWLLFLPNAPYILTDFVHLPGMRFVWWYEVGLLLAFAGAGCLLGIASLLVMHTLVRRRVGSVTAWLFVATTSGLSGLGIYLGRFLRWNSWDVFANPQILAAQLTALLGEAANYPRIIGVSGLFGSFLLLGYLTLHHARYQEAPVLSTQERSAR